MVMLLCGALTAQERDLRFPLTEDDGKFGRTLIQNGYADLAAILYRRLERQPDVPDEVKREARMGLLEVYRALIVEVPDPKERERYLKLCNALVKELISAYDKDNIPINLLYEKAVLTQTRGRSIAVTLNRFTDPKDRAPLVKRSEEQFDVVLNLFKEIQKQAQAQTQKLSRKPEENKEALKKLRMMQTKAALKLCWTCRYKALLYAEGSDLRNERLAKAIRVFDKFVEYYSRDMSVLSALYGRGMCHSDVGRPDKALEDFGKIIELGQGVPEVVGLRAECAIKIAEIHTDGGNYDEAIKAIDERLKEATAASLDDNRLLIQKARVLIARGAKLKETEPDTVRTLYDEALKLLRQVILSGSEHSRAANKELVALLKEGKIKLDLGPVEKLALAEANLAAKLYPEAAKLLKECLNAEGKVDGVPVAFRARLLLAQCYRYMHKYEESLKDFDEVLRRFPDNEEIPRVALERCWTLALYAKNSRQREIDERYVNALKELAEKYPGSEQGRNAWYYHGEALRQRRRYREAADAYKRLSEESKYFGRSRFLRGLALYNEFLKVRKKGKVDREIMLESEKQLTWAMMKGRPGLAETWHHEAATTLCDLYYETSRYQKVLDTVKTFAERYPEGAKTSGPLLFRRVRALAAMNRLDEAQEKLGVLAGQKADPEMLLRGYLTLGDVLMNRASTLELDNKDAEAKVFRDRALATLKSATKIIPEDNYDVWAWIAGKFFKLGDLDAALDASVKAGRAHERQQRAPDRKMWRLKLLRLKCTDTLNRWDDDALKLLVELEEQYPFNADIKMKRAAYLQKYKKDYETAEQIWKKVVVGVKPGSSAWMEAQLNRAICFNEMDKADRAKEVIKMVKGLVKKMKPEWKTRFDELEQKLK